MAICPVCGKLNPSGSRNCDLCGAPLGLHEPVPPSPTGGVPASDPLSGPVCPVCRRTNRSISVFCAFCGYRLKPAAAPNGAPAPISGAAYQPPSANGHAGAGAPDLRRPPMVAADEAGNIPSGVILKRRYRIMRKIAQGGMGAVYEASDTTNPGATRWAVKEMSPAALPVAERTQAIADFRREAQMLAGLEHPNLPRVVETFEEMGKNFLVMEFIPGRTLQNIIDSTPGFLSEERVRVWARQLFDVLVYLHSQNPPIIYRDIKPANVMLVEGTERIKLIDFGIARFHKTGKVRDTEAFGTAGYAPPEQYGKGQTDQRSDIYALGATLHYLATKHDPGLNPFNWLPARSYNPAISPQMDVALQRALNLDPDRRFQTMNEFAMSLGFVFAGNPPRPVEAGTAAAVYAAPQAAPAQRPSPIPPAAMTAAAANKKRDRQKAAPQKAQPQSTGRPATVTPDGSGGASKPAVAPAAVPLAATSVASVAVQASAAATAVPAVAAPISSPRTSAPLSTEPDHGTTSTKPPALVVSDQVLDMGEARWNKTPVRKVSLLNVGGGEMRGTVQAMQPWVALSVQNFRGNAQTIEVRVKSRGLRMGHLELQVPNLFAIIWSRARWAVPFIILWFWLLLLVANSLGQWLIWGLGALIGAVAVSELLMWWSALHIRWLVPAEKVNSGRLLVKSSGGEQQIEVRVKARPSWLRKAFGWTMAFLLMVLELGAIVVGALALLGYISLPGLM